ncbi:Short-chain dehydrogenase/reductase SDR [Ostreococcus tauri]|uniref:Short-chain dehydrogenase/reductase SDR n=1 Tax=Ostreococcus tauri TaxID=70448 RepID=A0A090M4H9_OSTTA|nr:Short-chain dehydrogenase/reductase SDR [Ostreococcus tauri]CEF96884.1 Short-chain dehydrogenase/reductase SDR [Ostreococcus tauri]|eukprot:XP_022838358.1 Short-chain dehydrogenase/reductase SDR [Ostreococcus tauri]
MRARVGGAIAGVERARGATRGRSRARMTRCDVTAARAVAIVTGANAGLGRETARALVKKGYAVVLATRDVERGERAAAEVRAAAAGAGAGGTAEAMRADLADFESIRRFARAFEAKYERLDALVCNAGVMALPNRETTVDGNETQMQVNHLGHFLLTSLLLPTMLKTPSNDKRIVNVSSVAHNFGTLDFHNINSEGFFGYPFLGWATYGRTKMANVLFTFELHRRLRASGIDDVCVNAVHPGVVDTELNRNLSLDFYPQLKRMGQLITPEQGARGQIALALDEKYLGVSGKYVSEMSNDGRPGVHEVMRSNGFSYDTEAWARLWKDSVRLTDAEWTI